MRAFRGMLSLYQTQLHILTNNPMDLITTGTSMYWADIRLHWLTLWQKVNCDPLRILVRTTLWYQVKF